MDITPNTLLVRAAHLMDTALATTIEPWRNLLGSEKLHAVRIGEEARTHLLLFLAANNGIGLPDKVLIYLEYRCRWLEDRDLFTSELGLPSVDLLLTKIYSLLSQQKELFVQHIKKTEAFRSEAPRVKSTFSLSSKAPDDINILTILDMISFFDFLNL